MGYRERVPPIRDDLQSSTRDQLRHLLRVLSPDHIPPGDDHRIWPSLRSAATGDRVAPDSPVLVIQPDRNLWLRAVFHDLPTGLLTPGRAASFVPAKGTGEIPVRFAQGLPSLRPDGGLTAFFEATTGAPH